MNNKKLSNQDLEQMLLNETKNITPNCLNEIKLKAQNLKIEENAEIEEENYKVRFSLKNLFSPMRLVITFIFIVALVFSITGISVYSKPVESLTIDVNPSIELSINKFNRVIKVNYNNEDASIVFSGKKIKNKKIDEAIDTCYDALFKAGYLDDVKTNMIVVSGYDESKNREEENVEIISHVCDLINQKNSEHKVKCEIKENVVNDEVKAFAAEFDITVGQVKVIVEIMDENPETELADLVTKSMKDLKKIYNSVKATNRSTEEKNPEETDPEQKTDEEVALENYEEFKAKIDEAIEQGKTYSELVKEKAKESEEKAKNILKDFLESLNSPKDDNKSENSKNQDNKNDDKGGSKKED